MVVHFIPGGLLDDMHVDELSFLRRYFPERRLRDRLRSCGILVGHMRHAGDEVVLLGRANESRWVGAAFSDLGCQLERRFFGRCCGRAAVRSCWLSRYDGRRRGLFVSRPIYRRPT